MDTPNGQSQLLLCAATSLLIAATWMLHREGPDGLPAGPAASVAQQPDPAQPVLVPTTERCVLQKPSLAKAATFAARKTVERSGRFLAGWVRSSAGETLEGARVVACVEGNEGASAASSTRTTFRGAFRVGPLPEGKIVLTISHPGHTSIARVHERDKLDVLVTLHPSSLVFGHVVHRGTARPAEIARTIIEASLDDEHGPWRRLGKPKAVDDGNAEAGRFVTAVESRRLLRLVVEGPGIEPATSECFRIGLGMRVGPLRLRANPRRILGRRNRTPREGN